MTDFLEDPRIKQAEALYFQAELLERRGDLTDARDLYAKAAALYATVALMVPSDLPRTRGLWAVAAVSVAARAGRFHFAIELAERFLAEPGSLTAGSHHELQTLLERYRLTCASAAVVAPAARGNRLLAWRDELRGAA